MSKMKPIVRSFETWISNIASISQTSEYRAVREELRSRQPDNLALQGFKAYSQNDEDGVIAAIFNRIPHNRTFLEIGVQDGRECNTHLLLIQGWRGAWVEADRDMCALVKAGLGGGEFPAKFRLIEDYARPDNVAAMYRDVCRFVQADDLDLFSLDIDGNDLFVLEGLLDAGCRPGVLCLEYNGRFPPPISVGVKYAEDRGWSGDDYYGASLQLIADVCGRYGYKLLTCTVCGSNAFFVRADLAEEFEFRSVADLWQPLRLNITVLPGGHPPSLKFLRDALHA